MSVFQKSTFVSWKNVQNWYGEMPQWIRGICCSKRPEIISQNLHGGSQPSATPVLKDSVHTSGLLGHWIHVMHRHPCRLKHTCVCTHTKKIKKIYKKGGNYFIDVHIWKHFRNVTYLPPTSVSLFMNQVYHKHRSVPLKSK